MRCGKFVIMLLFVCAFAVGYTARSDENTEKIQKKTQETAEAAKDYAFAQKAEFVEKMKRELAEINTRIDKLSEKAEKVGGDVKIEAQAKLQLLRDQAAQLNKQLDEAGNIAEANWNDFKSGFNKSYSDMKDTFKHSRQWLTKKIAP